MKIPPPVGDEGQELSAVLLGLFSDNLERISAGHAFFELEGHRMDTCCFDRLVEADIPLANGDAFFSEKLDDVGGPDRTVHVSFGIDLDGDFEDKTTQLRSLCFGFFLINGSFFSTLFHKLGLHTEGMGRGGDCFLLRKKIVPGKAGLYRDQLAAAADIFNIVNE